MRAQEIQIGDAKAKANDQTALFEKMQSEKSKLEQELRQSNARCQTVQGELAAAQFKIKEVEGRLVQKQQNCTSETCKQGVLDYESQLQRKSREIYDLTVKLGCIESENAELKSQIEDKNHIYEKRMDSSRLIAEQDLQDARRSIKELTEALAKQRLIAGRKAKVSHRGVQTRKV